MSNLIQSSTEKQSGLDPTLKTTSLLYLKEALSQEAYEESAEILKTAREIGVDQKEIEKLIQEHIVFLKDRDRKVVPFLR